MDVQQFYITKYDYSHHKSQQHKRYIYIYTDTCVLGYYFQCKLCKALVLPLGLQ